PGGRCGWCGNQPPERAVRARPVRRPFALVEWRPRQRPRAVDDNMRAWDTVCRQSAISTTPHVRSLIHFRITGQICSTSLALTMATELEDPAVEAMIAKKRGQLGRALREP